MTKSYQMADTKLKDKLIEKLESIEDEVLLQSVLNLIEIESAQSIQIYFNESQIEQLEASRLTSRSNGIKNEQVFSKTKEWLKK